MMYYYLVWVRSNRYHGSEPLTYASVTKLNVGSIIDVELQTELVLAVVVGAVSKPRFKTKIIHNVYALPLLPPHLLRLGQWLQSYYPSSLGVIAQQFLPTNFTPSQLTSETPQQYTAPQSSKLPSLNDEQQIAIDAMDEPNTYILHGKTGSGKTRIYIELSLKTISEGRSAIILTPEISLTSQLANNFAQVFDDRVIILHSQQAPKERREAWLRIIRATQPIIVIGPRSAIFSPIDKIGLIVLDEAHESAYKQEQSPQYQTVRVASYLARLTHATVVLGSATPSIADYYLAQQKNKAIIRLTQLAQTTQIPDTTISVVDMKRRELFSRSSYLSQPLVDAISTALGRNEQSLLYLNRRGTARLVMCEQCGWQANCPHCDLALTYHSDDHELRCHSCNFRTSMPTSCPVCSHPSILFKTAGTKAIAEEVARLFPEARLGRFDTDNTKHERFEQHYAAIHRGEVDILIGTQLLAKGLDLPKLSTLGVVLADTSLYLPDYSASERTFQLLSQVLGRVGRGHVAGHAFIQTYHPDHPVLATALAQDYESFYDSELEERRRYLFPPFTHLLVLSCRRASSKSAEAAAVKLKALIEQTTSRAIVEGPAPSFHERFQNKFQWQLVVKATHRSDLLSIIKYLPANWTADIDPNNLL
jgi:primosomal protein N' (replication factor Y)